MGRTRFGEGCRRCGSINMQCYSVHNYHDGKKIRYFLCMDCKQRIALEYNNNKFTHVVGIVQGRKRKEIF